MNTAQEMRFVANMANESQLDSFNLILKKINSAARKGKFHISLQLSSKVAERFKTVGFEVFEENNKFTIKW